MNEMRRCPICALEPQQEFESSSPTEMRKHFLVAHSVSSRIGSTNSKLEGSDYYVCLECARTFRRYWNLERHQLQVHKWVAVSDRRRWSRLRRRCARPDTQEQPTDAPSGNRGSHQTGACENMVSAFSLECPQCPQRFATAAVLWAHVRRVHVRRLPAQAARARQETRPRLSPSSEAGQGAEQPVPSPAH